MVLAQCQQFFFCNAVRSSCFHRKFQQMRKIKAVLDLCDQPVQLLRRQRGWCASTDIDGIQMFITEFLRRKINLFFQRIQILVHPFAPKSDGIGCKRAVQTGAWTKWNANIKAVAILIINLL